MNNDAQIIRHDSGYMYEEIALYATQVRLPSDLHPTLNEILPEFYCSSRANRHTYGAVLTPVSTGAGAASRCITAATYVSVAALEMTLVPPLSVVRVALGVALGVSVSAGADAATNTEGEADGVADETDDEDALGAPEAGSTVADETDEDALGAPEADDAEAAMLAATAAALTLAVDVGDDVGDAETETEDDCGTLPSPTSSTLRPEALP